ncbi:chemotaxis-specific protein-glutamate methyltransferase CheB [Cytophagaceae bacterium DM2B3-1]|uniref:Protein-glutamate methylesterase/protein-glutamine glutaminase n=1 Tax=Xanthocytophaga flava TaxID=3048013 RepID=A0ABT7CTG2_9BACT|nr:chemotaxis-specific protein-glutamate methyltransferase CheB [Xanthocytophaga flavus]MDJ1497070.1 chemotaxis-specific protein-glutamate methyltransferase CheB [Xanthocytophaga flavus]
MQTSPIQVLIADDSSFMRLVLSDIVGSDKDLNVIATAGNGLEAYEKTRQLKPDVILMDLIMPEYDGLYAVSQIMRDCPTPIVVLSGAGYSNDLTVFDAINAGAFDFIHKPDSTRNAKIRDLEHELTARLKSAVTVNKQGLGKKSSRENGHAHTFYSRLEYEVLAIGSSTGGTGAIEDILKKLPGNFPIPVVIAQHMPKDFVHSFSNRLNDMLPLKVKVAEEREYIQPGVVYLMPGNTNTYLKRDILRNTVFVQFTDKKFPEFNDPSVDCLFQSIADVYKEKALAVILSGMGRDGTRGMERLFYENAHTIAQDEKTSVIFGMPKSAIEKGVITKVLPIYDMAGYIVSCLS